MKNNFKKFDINLRWWNFHIDISLHVIETATMYDFITHDLFVFNMLYAYFYKFECPSLSLIYKK